MAGIDTSNMATKGETSCYQSYISISGSDFIFCAMIWLIWAWFLRDMFVDVTFFPYRSDTTTTAVSLLRTLDKKGIMEGKRAREAETEVPPRHGGMLDGKRMQDAMEKHGFLQQKQRSQITPKNSIFFSRWFDYIECFSEFSSIFI